MRELSVYLEIGAKRVFAAAVDWPGWCRSAKTEDGALEELVAYATRYAVVANRAKVRFAPATAPHLEIVERIEGSATTDFGAPGEIPAIDRQPLKLPEAARLAKLVIASWQVLDEVASSAPATLRKGPRGGGRDRDAMLTHVIAAEASYARKVGVKVRAPRFDDSAAVEGMRDAIAAALRGSSDGSPVVEKGWPPRYAAQRIAWHVLDHAWEIEDKSA